MLLEEPTTALLSPNERRNWRNPKPASVFIDLAAIWFQIALGITLYAIHPTVLTWVVGILLVAGGQHGLGLAGHEFAHYLVIPSHKRLNDLIGNWLFLGFSGNSMILYRQRHFAHHRSYSTKQDTKTLYRRDYSGSRFLLEVCKALSGWDYAEQLITVFRRKSADDRQPGNESPSLFRVLLPPAICQILMLVILGSVSLKLYLLLWLLPLVTVNTLFSKLRSTVEHLPLASESGKSHDGVYFRGTNAPFVRSVRATWLESLFLSKINFSYHGEHHLYPDVSYQYLPLLHQRARKSPVQYGYFSLLHRLWKNQ